MMSDGVTTFRKIDLDFLVFIRKIDRSFDAHFPKKYDKKEKSDDKYML